MIKIVPVHMLIIVTCAKNSNISPASRAVITIGVEDEDRLDQWVEDAESVGFTFTTRTFSFILKFNPFDFNPLFAVHGSRGLRMCACHLRTHADCVPQQEERLAACGVLREESWLSGAAGGALAESRGPLPEGRGAVVDGSKVKMDGGRFTLSHGALLCL